MKLLPLFLPFLLLPTHVNAEPTFVFDTGPDWRGERIVLPPSFAPALGWSGVEVIRFAPGMFQPGTENFFSYALVFLLDEDSDVSDQAIHREILVYYQGLSTAVMRGKGQEVAVDTFTLKLEPESGKPEPRRWRGVLDWVEPFATQARQTLQMEVQLWNHGSRPALFFAVSPQGADHAIWTELRRIRDTFRFED